MRYTNYNFHTDSCIKKVRNYANLSKKHYSNRDVITMYLKQLMDTYDDFPCDEIITILALEFSFRKDRGHFIFVEDKVLTEHLQQCKFVVEENCFNFPTDMFILNYPIGTRIAGETVPSCLYAKIGIDDLNVLIKEFFEFYKCQNYPVYSQIGNCKAKQYFFCCGIGKRKALINMHEDKLCDCLNGNDSIPLIGNPDPNLTAQDLFLEARFIACLGTYLNAYTEALVGGCPSLFRKNKKQKRGNTHTITTTPAILHKGDRQAHFRIGHYRTLSAPRYKKMRGKTIFVPATYVGGEACVNTAKNKGELPSSSWDMSLFCPPRSKAV